ncbi:MAG: RDD family protein [Gemmobacter sp.]
MGRPQMGAVRITMEPPMIHALPDPVRHAAFYDGVPVRRVWAWVIDAVITGLVAVMILPFTAFVALFVFPLLFGAVNLAYRSATLASLSATPGMWVLGIEFRQGDGSRFDAPTAVLHTLGTMFTWTTILPQVASVALMAMSARGQGLTDMVLGTVAIRRPGAV